jgi:hypothetical protein
MPYYAGLDRADTPNPIKRGRDREVYTVCFVATERGPNEIRELITDVRAKLSVPDGVEIKGGSSPAWVQAGILQALVQTDVRVAAVLYEKVDPTRTPDAPSDIIRFQEGFALELFDAFAQRYRFARLWCDEDVEGKKRQLEFETALQRVHRKWHGDARFSARHRCAMLRL